MTTKDIKLKNLVDIQINYGEWRRYMVTSVENRFTENVLGVTLTACESDKIIDVIQIDFEPTKTVSINE